MKIVTQQPLQIKINIKNGFCKIQEFVVNLCYSQNALYFLRWVYHFT